MKDLEILEKIEFLNKIPDCLSTWSCFTLVNSLESPLCSDYTLNIFKVPFHNADFHFCLQTQ